MKALFKFWIILMVTAVMVVSCNKDEEDIPPPVKVSETGILKLNLALVIKESNARLKEVNTDDFIVKIFKVVDGEPDELVEEFPRFADMPAEIELATGTYYVEAQNIDPPLAAEFEQPWYYGVSENFNIDKEDLVAVTVDCALANYKVGFDYSQNVIDNFTTWNATATRLEESLVWAQGDDREGYFLVGEPLSIAVHLEYEKVFDVPEVISRDFYATIEVPAAATLYQVHIDAVLQDGIISIGINVDDGFEVIDVNPISSVTFSGPGSVEEIEGGASVEGDPDNSPQGFGRDFIKWYISDVWLADQKTVFWGPSPNMIKASMDGDVFEDGDPNEILDFDAEQSDLANGYLVFNGTTKILHFDGSLHDVDLKFELTVKDKVSQTPRAMSSPLTYGLPASIGGLVELTGITDEIEVDFRILAKSAGTTTYSNFLEYYDTAPTAPGPAYTSFTGGFYWSNQ